MISLFLLCAFSAISFARNCDELGILVYEDMGCEPSHETTDGCPSSYTCSGLRPSSTECVYKGKRYELGDRVDVNTSPSCDQSCTCVRGTTSTKFGCALFTCPEVGPPLQPGCYYKYSLDKCCGTAVCTGNEVRAKCLVDGKEYLEGDRFFPTDSCLRCVCQKGFKGKLVAPFCDRRACGVQLKKSDKLQAGCSPVYRLQSRDTEKIRCCPNSWICPDGSENVKGIASSNKSCKFGSKTLKVGQSFERTVQDIGISRKVQCECRVPPLLSCISDN